MAKMGIVFGLLTVSVDWKTQLESGHGDRGTIVAIFMSYLALSRRSAR